MRPDQRLHFRRTSRNASDDNGLRERVAYLLRLRSAAIHHGEHGSCPVRTGHVAEASVSLWNVSTTHNT